MEMYKQKFGEDRIQAMIPNMKKVGDEVGIKFSYGGNIGNTFDSHRLMWKARDVGGSQLQNNVVEALFEAYFEKEQSLGDIQVLKACATKAGMPQDALQDFLENPTVGKKEVQQERIEFGRKWNCRGVPLFIIDSKYPLSGAQPPEAFHEIFEQIVNSDED